MFQENITNAEAASYKIGGEKSVDKKTLSNKQGVSEEKRPLGSIGTLQTTSASTVCHTGAQNNNYQEAYTTEERLNRLAHLSHLTGRSKEALITSNNFYDQRLQMPVVSSSALTSSALNESTEAPPPLISRRELYERTNEFADNISREESLSPQDLSSPYRNDHGCEGRDNYEIKNESPRSLTPSQEVIVDDESVLKRLSYKEYTMDALIKMNRKYDNNNQVLTPGGSISESEEKLKEI